jgi:hypothetical protein
VNLGIQHAERGSALWRWAAESISRGHYLASMPDSRTSFEVWIITIGTLPAGALVFGRPEATRCADWYGGVDDVAAGRCGCTRWQVLNLARVWIAPQFQAGSEMLEVFPDLWVPGYYDRHLRFRSTLASDAIKLATQMIGFEYLMRRPPVFLDEPYQVEWLLSYCDTSKHKGTIYRAAGFELYRTNERGIQTWRIPLPGLTAEQHAKIRERSVADSRARRYRAGRAAGAQMPLALEMMA